MVRAMRVVLAPAVVVSLAAACGDDETGTAQFDVETRESVVDTVVPIRISGLPENATVMVRSETTADGVPFKAEAEYRADGSGRIDLNKDPSRGGDYEGVFPMGLVASMQPVDDLPEGKPWPGLFPEDGQEIGLTALIDGESVANTSIVRLPHANGVHMEETTVADQGFVGNLWLPADDSETGPAVLLIGGAGGGFGGGQLEAQALASRGYPALAIAYFAEDGLPDLLSDIPMEYFETALNWFADQPGIDPKRIVLAGSSAGTEVALFLAARHPELVHAVAARVPSNLMLCGPPNCQPAWTLDGKTVPYETEFGPDAAVADAVIKVERFPGPIFTVCGGMDLVWPSCPMAGAIADRRQEHGVGQDDVALSYPDGGHGSGGVPNIPAPVFDDSNPAATRLARADAWPQYIEFLDQLR